MIKNKDNRSKSSAPNDETTKSKFLNSENELIKINKKLNNILQHIELQNRNLFENVIFNRYFSIILVCFVRHKKDSSRKIKNRAN